LRIGLGEDSHRTEPGGPLRLGGVDVPHDRHLVGYSDADVLLHAVTDALLGAAALPDIGQMFPNTDEVNRNRDSAEMLALAAAKVAEGGYRIVNLDCVVHVERPKLADYIDAIRHRLAGILQINPNQIGLKAKTGEGVGPVGSGQAIEARCVASLTSGEPWYLRPIV
jgi:2-C-methyl-D-erythritol 2,4-cyclodiphosphate synthase